MIFSTNPKARRNVTAFARTSPSGPIKNPKKNSKKTLSNMLTERNVDSAGFCQADRHKHGDSLF